MADFVYRLPRESPPPAPTALRIGMDWQAFHTPPYAGGLADQPIRLMKDVRLALYAWNSFKAWDAASSLTSERFTAFCSANKELVKFMNEFWRLQDDAIDDKWKSS